MHWQARVHVERAGLRALHFAILHIHLPRGASTGIHPAERYTSACKAAWDHTHCQQYYTHDSDNANYSDEYVHSDSGLNPNSAGSSNISTAPIHSGPVRNPVRHLPRLRGLRQCAEDEQRQPVRLGGFPRGMRGRKNLGRSQCKRPEGRLGNRAERLPIHEQGRRLLLRIRGLLLMRRQ